MMSKLAIVYFSESNNTKAAAEYVLSKVEAKIIRIQGKGNVNPLKGMLKIAAHPVGEPWKEIADCERILLMSPVYAWSGVPEILSFLKNADLAGKELMIVTSGADTNPKAGMKVAAQYQKLVENAGGIVGSMTYYQGGDFKKFSGADVIAQHVDAVLPQVLAWVNK
ncbi:MAG: hypothetical protein V2J07_07460 [Anaerolineae bacterium]|jgi:hypothetical protein|nr:hypothetical protein [Anaerolineae bacterium]